MYVKIGVLQSKTQPWFYIIIHKFAISLFLIIWSVFFFFKLKLHKSYVIRNIYHLLSALEITACMWNPWVYIPQHFIMNIANFLCHWCDWKRAKWFATIRYGKQKHTLINRKKLWWFLYKWCHVWQRTSVFMQAKDV